MRKHGPDATRYLLVGQRLTVSRPFNLRWLLPVVCRDEVRRWWTVYLASWPILAAGMVWWVRSSGHGWPVAFAAAAFLLALPGILGPSVSIPVQVDLPGTAVTVAGVAFVAAGVPVAGVLLLLVAVSITEKAAVVAALMLWAWWPLLLLVVPLIADRVRRPGPDPLGPTFQHIADHPVRSSLEHHAGRWRDGWLLVAPWGACVAALYQPDWVTVTALAVAYSQLLIATDTVRLVQHVAGPVVAIAAAQRIPAEWLMLVVAVHAMWWVRPERV